MLHTAVVAAECYPDDNPDCRRSDRPQKSSECPHRELDKGVMLELKFEKSCAVQPAPLGEQQAVLLSGRALLLLIVLPSVQFDFPLRVRAILGGHHLLEINAVAVDRYRWKIEFLRVNKQEPGSNFDTVFRFRLLGDEQMIPEAIALVQLPL